MSYYWDRSKILSYNKLFNFVVGSRGCGKTYNCKRWIIDRYIRCGERAMYIMRYVTELDEALLAGRWFDDVQDCYPDYIFKVDNYTGYIKEKENEDAEWERIVQFKALSQRALKAISDKRINKIIFDEFIPLPGIPYIKDEVEKLLELYFTISRGRDVRMVFLGNNVNVVNPYFSYFGMKYPDEGKIIADGEIAIENVKNPEFRKHMKNTRFGQLVKDTNYGKYAIDNESYVDLTTFVRPLPKHTKCVASIITSYGPLYLWLNTPLSLHISQRGTNNIPSFAIDSKSHSEQTIMADFNGVYIKTIINRYYKQGLLFFDNEETKGIFFQTCQKFIK